MTNASPTSSRAGWSLFKSSDSRLSKDELNDRLSELSLDPISERIYHHYGRLSLAGYDRYVAINRFEIARSSRPYEGRSSSGRYTYRPANVPAILHIYRDQLPISAICTATEMSEVGSILKFSGEVSDSVQRLRLKRGEHVRVELLEPAGSASARVTEIDYATDGVLIDIEFVRSMPITEYVEESELTSKRLTISMRTDTDGIPIPADVFGSRIYFLFQMLDASRAIVNEVIEQSTDRTERAQPAEIERLTVTSPIEIAVALSIGVGAVATAAWKIVAVYERWQGAQSLKQDVRAKKLKNDATEETNATALKIHELVRSEIGLKDNDASSSGTLEFNDTRIKALIQNELLPSAHRLALQGVEDLSLHETDEPT